MLLKTDRMRKNKALDSASNCDSWAWGIEEARAVRSGDLERENKWVGVRISISSVNLKKWQNEKTIESLISYASNSDGCDGLWNSELFTQWGQHKSKECNVVWWVPWVSSDFQTWEPKKRKQKKKTEFAVKKIK